MKLFIIRHAHAVAAADDPKRPLSDRGCKQVSRLVKFLKPSGVLATSEVWHSRLVRSKETADLLVKKLNPKAKLVEVRGLEGEDDPNVIANRLKQRTQPLIDLAAHRRRGESTPVSFEKGRDRRPGTD